jgi:anti-anti-sigma factor
MTRRSRQGERIGITPHGIRVEEPEGTGVVTLVGEHDAFGAEPLRRELERLLGTGTPIVVDLSEATFIDSSTVGVLLTAFRRGEEAGLTVGLVLPAADAGLYVVRLLQTTKLDAVFPIHASVADAVAAAQRQH